MGFSFFLLLFILFTAMIWASKGISQYVPSCISIEMTSNCFQFLLDDKKWRIFRSKRFDSIVISLIILFVRHDDEIVFIQRDRKKREEKTILFAIIDFKREMHTHTHTQKMRSLKLLKSNQENWICRHKMAQQTLVNTMHCAIFAFMHVKKATHIRTKKHTNELYSILVNILRLDLRWIQENLLSSLSSDLKLNTRNARTLTILSQPFFQPFNRRYTTPNTFL